MKPEKSIRRLLNSSGLFVASILLFLSAASRLQGNVENVKRAEKTISFEIVIDKPDIIPDGDGRVRIRLDGYGTFSPPGAAEVPGRIFNIAVPESGDVSFSAAVLERDDLGDIRLARKMGSRLVKGKENTDLTETYLPKRDPWEKKGLLPVVSACREEFFGRVRVLPVRVSPVEKRAGGYSIARKILIKVNFRSESTLLGFNGPQKTSLSKAWRDIYERVLINPADAVLFAKEPDRIKIQNLPNGDSRAVKLSIPETGLYILEADRLASSAGGGPFASNQFALKRYYYDESEPDLTREVDIPMRIIKGDESSENYFEADDKLIFHAAGIRDDPAAGDINAAFTDTHIVWLREGEAGVTMTGGGGLSPASGPPEPYFNSEINVRKDTYYHKHIKAGAVDFYFVSSPGLNDISVPFYCSHPHDNGTFSLTARMRGYETNGIKLLDFKISNSSHTALIGSGDLIDNNQETFIFESIPSSLLVDGDNQLIVEYNKEYGCMVNDFSVEYPAGFIAGEDVLQFNLSGTGGTKSVEIEGFDSSSGYLIDITDESNISFDTLGAELFSGPGGDGKYTLSLELPSDIDRRYIALGENGGNLIPEESIELDSPSSLRGEVGPFNTLVISHSDFLPPSSSALTSHVRWREDQGYRILTADVQDIYDEFNGGLPSCVAVKRFIKYGFIHWGVEFVMLVGDASEDHKRLYLGDSPDTQGSPPDYVPSYTFSMRMDSPGYQDEVIATDKYYSFLDDGASPVGGMQGEQETVIDALSGEVSDIRMPAVAYPDVFIGRLPVGSDIEAAGVFSKLKRYEDPTLENSWRKNVILFADDAWSGPASSYVYRSSEEAFASSMDSVSAGIERTFPGGVNVEKLYLSKWTEDITNFDEARDSTRKYFTPYLIDRLNAGSLFFGFQGHAGRDNLTHEFGFSMRVMYRDVNDLFSYKNSIFLGMGCHISEFARLKEYSQSGVSGPGGDCISEQMILKVTSGAAAAYASTAYEDLRKNNELCENIFDVVFSDPPTDTVPPLNEETRARWILGELVTAAEIAHINRTSYGLEQTNRHVLFGDPMMNIDSGPPLMNLEIDYGKGWKEVGGDTLNPVNPGNRWDFRFTARDLTALGGVKLTVEGSDWTDSLVVTPLEDISLTYARSYDARLDSFSVGLEDESVVFRVLSPGGNEAGRRDFFIGTVLKLYYIRNGVEVEVLPAAEAPSEGDFRLKADFPVSVVTSPEVRLDDSEYNDIVWDETGEDSTVWTGDFNVSFAGGNHSITVVSGEFSKDYLFTVSGGELAVETFNFPNPFTSGTNITFLINGSADSGKIEIYNVSGILMERLEIPSDRLSSPSNSSVYWDGTDRAGSRVANGTYVYVVTIKKSGKSVSRKGKIVKME
ncbi:MAG: C25 family cysteine peptidase [Candidatus Krumholzibacteriota bacterium]|nr:C25 family cysteine peptidase [Candidatus Krumholzibacteriota bacterium]